MRIAPPQAGAVALAPAGGAAGAGIPRPAPLPGQAPVPAQPGMPVPPTEAGAPTAPGALPGPAPGAAAPETVAVATLPSSLLVAAPLAARSGSDIAISLSLTPGGAAVRATAELGYDPLQLEPVGAVTSAAGRLPVRIEGSAAVRFRVLLAGGRAQVRVENVVGLDNTGGTVPVATPGAVEISVNQ
jgi:hypothetical protein